MTDDPEFAWWEETQQILLIRIDNVGGYATTDVTAMSQRERYTRRDVSGEYKTASQG